MGGRYVMRRLGHGLRLLGMLLMAWSGLALVALPVMRPASAYPDAWSTLGRVLASGVQVATGAPVPAPTASPAPTPGAAKPAASPEPHTGRGGPLTFKLTGNLALGEQLQRSTRGNAAVGISNYNSNLQTENAGMLGQIERRTPTTTLTVGVPLALSARESAFGELQAGYYTPTYGLLWGSQPLTVLGGVPLGATLRGLSFVMPLRGGDVTLFEGPAFGEQYRLMRVIGLRARRLLGSALLEFGLDRGRFIGSPQTVDAGILGVAASRGKLNQLFEGAVERRAHPDPGEPTSAFSYQYRADYGGNALYSTLTVRRVGNGFLNFGSGLMQRDDLASFGLQGGNGKTTYGIDEALERSGEGSNLNDQRRDTLSFGRTFGPGIATLFNYTDQRSQTANGVAWTGTAGMQLGFTLRGGMSAIVGSQLSRTTATLGSPIALVAYSGELQRQFGDYSASAGYQATRQVGAGQSSTISAGTFALTRTFGATSLTFTTALTHTVSPQSDAVQITPLLSVTRQISPALSVGVTYGLQVMRDSINPTNDGHTRIFSIQFAAPFALGNGGVQGRINPHLPATISGSVLNGAANENQFGFNSAVAAGVANVEVVLDNQQVQRTDLAGHFQFNFVSPGEHQVSVETASLPRGVTTDQPYASITVFGGQTGQVFFRIGSYGGIAGHVFARNASGSLYPLSGVRLRLDSNLYAQTDVFGAYSFGRLAAGKHTLTVQTSSLPATVNFSKTDATKTVDVQNGAIERLNFVASPLGSIQGEIVYDRSLAPEYAGSPPNAYVVAEPGNYAAIVDQTGAFYLDNLPAGTYSLNVDPETVPEGLGNTSGSQTISVRGDEHVKGVLFRIGRKQKPVVYSLLENQAPPVTLSLLEDRLPPGGATRVSVRGAGAAKSVEVTGFGDTFALTYVKPQEAWLGMLDVPQTARDGRTAVAALIAGRKVASAELTIDGRVPLVVFTMTPRNPARGQYVAVQARFLADVRPGDEIRWQDGQVTRLGEPVVGRVYRFTVKVSIQPMRGVLLTKQGDLPITLR